MIAHAGERNTWNTPRFVAGTKAGHYESWFQRGNHATRPLAFWIRYTIFCPKGRPGDAIGESWAVFFDGENSRITAVKSEFPLAACSLGVRGNDIHIGESLLGNHALTGVASSNGHSIAWDLAYECEMPPLLLLPAALYETGFPKAKALAGFPNAVFRGRLNVDGDEIEIDGWKGSQNHNWGSRHTDSYAWGQVAGFDEDEDAFLECATAQVKIGPLWTPRLSFLVLRCGGREYAFNTIRCALRARGSFDFFEWNIATGNSDTRLTMHMTAAREDFTALTYYNPPGGSKTCLNSKIANCEVTLETKGQPPRTLTSTRRAAFEILTDRSDHGVPVAD